MLNTNDQTRSGSLNAHELGEKKGKSYIHVPDALFAIDQTRSGEHKAEVHMHYTTLTNQIYPFSKNSNLENNWNETNWPDPKEKTANKHSMSTDHKYTPAGSRENYYQHEGMGAYSHGERSNLLDHHLTTELKTLSRQIIANLNRVQHEPNLIGTLEAIRPIAERISMIATELDHDRAHQTNSKGNSEQNEVDKKSKLNHKQPAIIELSVADHHRTGTKQNDAGTMPKTQSTNSYKPGVADRLRTDTRLIRTTKQPINNNTIRVASSRLKSTSKKIDLNPKESDHLIRSFPTGAKIDNRTNTKRTTSISSNKNTNDVTNTNNAPFDTVPKFKTNKSEVNSKHSTHKPIKMLIKKIKHNSDKNSHTHNILSEKTEEYKAELIVERTPSSITVSDQNQLNRDLEKDGRVEYYKSLDLKTESFDSLNKLPDFNTGRKPIKPTDFTRLERMLTVKVESPEEYTTLNKDIDECQQFGNGEIDINKMTCDKNGKVTILCDEEDQKDMLIDYLKNKSYDAKPIKFKNFTFSVFGIPKLKSSEQVLSELETRDSGRFNKSGYKISDRFPIDKAKDAIVLSCNVEMTIKINKKPYIHLGKKIYRLQHFIELIQCFKCSKFGHKTEECRSKNLCCPNCASEHELKECRTNYIPKCGNCLSLDLGNLTHSSWDVRCPYRHKWIKKQKGYD